MRYSEPRSMLLPPDYEEQQAAARRARRVAFFRSPWTRGVVSAFFVVTILARPAPVTASFTALLGQTIAYVNILIDEWEKHSRILEDHLDKVTGIVQPFSQLHAGVRELTDLSRIKPLLKLGDSYRTSLMNPDCYRYPVPSDCTLQGDFDPPELRATYYDGVYAIGSGTYNAYELEQRVRNIGTYDSVRGMFAATGLDQHPSVAEIFRTADRVQRNIWDAQWKYRRARSIAARTRHVARPFIYSAPLGPDGCPVVNDAGLRETDLDDDLLVYRPTFMDQVRHSDCLDPTAHLEEPLEEERAHTSSSEAATMQTAALFGVVDQTALALEREAARIEELNARDERTEARRRRRLGIMANHLGCVATDSTRLFSDGRGGCGTVPDLAAAHAAAVAEECRVPLNPRSPRC